MLLLDMRENNLFFIQNISPFLIGFNLTANSS